jgi:DNA-binding transcriptional ArsR family regulator
MLEILNITKALSDENRVRALMMLKGGELCVCQIIEMLGLAPSTVSKHMSILRQANLVESRKQGRWMYYSLADNYAPVQIKQAIDWVISNAANDLKIQQDKKKLHKLLTIDKEELCKMQRS